MTALRHDKEPERVSDRAFRVLGAMREMGRGPHPLRSIVHRSALSRSTVQRVITSGLRAGVIRQPRHGHYALAAQLDADGAPPQPSAAAHHVLRALADRLGHTVSLHTAVLADVPMQMCTGYAEAPRGVSLRSAVGRPRPLHADAAGRAVLAHLALPHPCPEERHRVRTRGWAASPGPVRGTRMIAAPVLRFGIAVGALGVTADPAVLDAGLPVCVDHLRRAAAALAAGRQ
ncbi:helix-turn-helix domain-containing protein [Streptomyces sp. TRM76323]|uniref:Helix-turn-helix domain-containing protein n=1 Tax=Streptomyces tamarix TaxID=3078565 RepID=A0ABU3QHH8_9ACTN|nr:helix-turn-helix domain-containing protein [Streptomyces tamarix]MDT9682184.1 helix-turn-helix domain-containing protein [Streptomyces tamarix]